MNVIIYCIHLNNQVQWDQINTIPTIDFGPPALFFERTVTVHAGLELTIEMGKT